MFTFAIACALFCTVVFCFQLNILDRMYCIEQRHGLPAGKNYLKRLVLPAGMWLFSWLLAFIFAWSKL